MKKFNYFGLLAVAALAFVGCSKEVEFQGDETPGTHTVTFKVEKIVDTKTAVVEGDVASYVWTSKDDENFHIYENGVEATEIAMVLNDDNSIATFTASFADTDATEFEYTAVYGSKVSNSRNPLIPDSQSPALDSFDPAADVLVSAEPITLEGNGAADKDTEFLFKLKRVVSVNKMTLKGLEAGETVKQVELISTDGYFSSRYKFDDGSYMNSDGKKQLTLDFTALDNAVADSEGAFPVYFTSSPVSSVSFSVKVTTDKNVYVRDDFTSKLTLEVGKFRRFGINLSGYSEAISEGTVYTLVENTSDLFDGATYVIAAVDVNVVMGLYTGGNNHPVVTVNKGADALGKSIVSIDNTMAVEPIILSANGEKWYMTNAYAGNEYEGQYLVCGSGTNNNLKETAAETNAYREWNVSVTDGVASIVNANSSAQRSKLFYNSSNDIFACYAPNNTSYKNVALYVDKSTCKELIDPELEFEGDATINVAWNDIEDFTEPTLNNPYDVTVTYASSKEDVATVDPETGEITFVGNGTTEISASSVKTDEFKAGFAKYTLVVSGAPIEYAFTTIGGLNALAAETTQPTEFVGTLTNAVISFAPDAKNAVIRDATGSVLVFKDGHGYKQGQTFTGELTITLTKYNNASEITAIDAEFTGDEAVVNPESVTLADLVGNFATWQNAYVEVEDLEVVSTSGKNINVKNGDKTYVVYSSAANATCAAGDIIKVTGTIAQYSSKDQVKAWTTEAIEITQEHEQSAHTIAFSQPAEGGSLTVTVDGNPVESGEELKEGTVVTLTATVSEGYTFDGWTVTGATVSGNTSTATITVGTSDIEIAANISRIVSGTTVEFTGANSGGMNSTAGAQSGTIGDVTIAISNGLANSDQIRTYKNATITLSVPSGKTISKIVFTCTAEGASNYGPGCFAEATGYSYSGYVGTWIGSSNSVTLTASGGQVRATSIKITYN